MIIIAGGLPAAAIGSGTADAAALPAACATSSVIEIESFGFNPPAVPPGKSSTATLIAVNCTDQPQQVTEIWSGHFAGPSGGIPSGCPVIDPLSFSAVFAPNSTITNSVGYLVPLSCAATELVVTVDIYGNSSLLTQGTAVLEILSPVA